MKIYRMTLKRMMMTALMMLIAVSAMSAEQKVWLSITGKGTVEVTTDKDPKNPLIFTDGVTTLTDAGGQMITISVKPELGYTVTSVKAQLTTDAGNADTRADVDASFLDVKKASDTEYTFEMPKDFNVRISVTFESMRKDGPNDPNDLSGVYYIGSVGYNAGTPANNFYLCPTEGWCYYKATDDFWLHNTAEENKTMPFLTTYKCKTNDYHSGNSNDAIWIIEKAPAPNSAYYYIKQASTGRYLTSNGEIRTTGNPDRMRVHLDDVAPENLDAKKLYTKLFTIVEYSTYLTISPKGVVGGADDRNWLVVNGGNKNALTGQSGKQNGPTGYTNTAGIIGIYTQSDPNAAFYLEPASAARPTITNNFDGTFTIATTTTGATIYYTTDGTTPTIETTNTGTTSVTVDQTEGMTVIKAISKGESDAFPSVVTTYELPKCERPVIKVSGGLVTITCATEGAAIYYTTNGDPATSSSSSYTEPFAKGDAETIRAIATKAGYLISTEAKLLPPTEVSSSSQITDMNGNYILASNFTSSGSIGTSDNPFKGTIDGNLNTFTLSYPLVAYADGATIKNVILDNVDLNSGNENGNAGAICCEATGDTRIFNCGILSGSVEGSNKVGGIVGLLDGRARVINCYSFANITSGSDCGGIVGFNNVPSTSGNLQTMVMNCMFYGNITGGNAAPIYGGDIIHNKYASDDNTGLNNYCYFLYDEEKNPYVKTIANDKYHGALGAEERFLNRFELFRMTLNSTRNLAAYYAIGDATQKEEIAKWVLDKGIAPYPILKVQGKYPSVVNPDANHATAKEERNKGGLLGTLSVTISGVGSGAVFNAPTGASITTSSLTLNITDKDYDNYNYNYKKVQLPYYNEVGEGNYKGGRVVTGWKITSITGGTLGSFSTATYDYPSFNFVDRKCTNKDLYSVSGRVFAQGAYWEVPDGVTAIEIEPYWAEAVYVSDANYDMTYTITITGTGSDATATATKYGVTVCGSCPTVCNEQTVYTDLSTAISNLSSDADHTVYDYAVVLVGNYHQAGNDALVNDGKPVTFMSADLDGDNEPDNTLFYYHNQRRSVSPVRFDFLNIPGIGMVKRTHDSSMDPEPGIFAPQGWFEITNTVFIRFGQFEYAGSNSFTKTILAPLILQGGIYEQFVSCARTNAQNTNYLLIGGNAWFKNFANGCHTNQANKTPKVPINVTGGDYTNFYLTGIYQPASNENTGNAECYIDGGRFSEVAGAGMQQIKGNVTWLINAADITNFYGGGINAAKPITGHISTTISNSYVDEFYGGPKFGDMAAGKKVTTNATDCHFGKFFGAGYGGTAFNRVGWVDNSNPANTRSWDGYVNTYYDRAYSTEKDGTSTNGISTSYDYEFISHSDGSQTVARFFVNYASLSLASTRNVTSTLSGCTIGTFYGGGSLGAVNGDINSTLTNCTVTDNAYGAGFSASVPTVEVWNAGAYLNPGPTYNRTANVFNNANVKTPKDNNQFIVYTWSKEHGTNASPFTDTEDGKHYIHTDESLDGLGTVTGKVTLNIEGTTTVAESVYGGGEESSVSGDTEVNVTGGTIIGTTGMGGATHGNVYGGGKGKEGEVTAGLVKGNTNVTISGTPTILHNIYGGGAYGSVGDFTYDGTTGMPTALATSSTGACTVTITGGTIGSNGHENGMVFGSSRGDVATPEGTPAIDPNDRMAWVYSTHVTIGDTSAETSPAIKGSVYGSGENGHTFQNTIVDIKKGIIGITTGEPITDNNGTPDDTSDDTTYSGALYPFRGNVYGGGCGTDMYDSNNDGTKDKYNPLAGIVQGTATVNITGGQVVHNVYGAGAMGSVGTVDDENSGKTTINISGGRIGYDGDRNGHVFGAARGEFGISTATSGLANVRESKVNISYPPNSTPTADNDGKNAQLIAGSVFGGGEAGTVKGSVAVNMTGGLILKDLYGGGALADTQTSNWDASNNTWATGKTSASTTTTVHLTGGTIDGEAYGGGLGETGKPAYVWGDVLVELNPITTSLKGCIVNEVFGGNNVNGSPKGNVTVHVYGTQNKEKATIADKFRLDNESLEKLNLTETTIESDDDYLKRLKAILADKITVGTVLRIGVDTYQAVYDNASATAEEVKETINNITTAITTALNTGTDDEKDTKSALVNALHYDVKAVYGGGNQAAYIPVTPNTSTTSTPNGAQTQVIIEGCGETSIESVYGGGNAAAVPETNVDIKEAYEIFYVFGGGNGYSATNNHTDPSALNYNPGADVGVYNGSDYGTGYANAVLRGGYIHEVYGGSNQKGEIKTIRINTAPVDGGCALYTDKIVFAGKDADVDGDLIAILGCKPTTKTPLVFAGADNANVNGNVELTITSGTFGQVFGGNNLGGVIKGHIVLNIEETGCNPIVVDELYLGGNQAAYSVYGYNEDETCITSGTKVYTDPILNVISCTSIGKVFGGGLGEKAIMYADPTVNINMIKGTATGSLSTLGTIGDVYGGGNEANVVGNTNVNIGTKAEVWLHQSVDDNGKYTMYPSDTNQGKGIPVVGANITGNVYGGGNEAEVTGNTNVTIGKAVTTTTP